MSKLTPAVSRLAAILELFARDPSRSWSLSEIVGELGISRSTCHALLISLDLANLVYRDEDKRYVLGSLAVSVGRAAASHYSPADLVQRELTQLSQEWGAIAVSNYRRRDAILVREWIDTVRVDAGGSRAGASIPMAPPWGAIFYAWEPRAEQRRWLERASAMLPDDAVREQLAQGLADIRRQGFTCGLRLDHANPAALDMTWEQAGPHTNPFAAHLDPKATYALDFLAAPVFDDHGRILFVVSVTGFVAPMTGGEIQNLAIQLKRRCRKLGHFLSGQERAATPQLSRDGGA
jgi:DNA-binding IclR family transcriptional regulator